MFKIIRKKYMQKIYCVDAPCGSGKTNALIKHISKFYIGQKSLIIQPTKDLCRQTYHSLIENVSNKAVFILHSDNTKNLVKDINTKIEEINATGYGILIITQEAFKLINKFPDKKSWYLYIDEIPSMDSSIELLIPNNINIVKDNFKVELYNDELYELKLKSKKTLSEFEKRVDDTIDRLIKPLFKSFRLKNKVYVKKDTWDRIILSREISKDTNTDYRFGNNKNKLYFLIINDISKYTGFKKTSLISANIKNSIFYAYGVKNNFQFTTNKSLTDMLNFERHINGERITIYYLQNKRASKFYKTLYNKTEEKLNEEILDELVISHVGDKRCIYACNDIDAIILKENFIKVKNISHGSNKYIGIHNVYVKSVLNRTNKHLSMLSSIGIDTDFANKSMFHEITYQICMRSSIRDINCDEPVNIYVNDKASAEYLATMFQGCSIQKLGDIIDNKKGLNHYQKRKKETLNELFNDIGITNDKKCHISLFPSKYSKEATIVEFDTTFQLISEFKKYFSRNLLTEKDGVVFSPSVFDLSGRSNNNVICSDILIIDIDNGDLSPEEFINICKHKLKITGVVMNTFSRSEMNLNSFRVLIPLSRKVFIDEYKEIHSYIRNEISKYGYVNCKTEDRQDFCNSKISGIDLTKVSPACIFYLPCQHIDRLEYAFFEKIFCENKHVFDRHVLNVDLVINKQLPLIDLKKIDVNIETPLQNKIRKPKQHNINTELPNNYSNQHIKELLMSGKYNFHQHELFGRVAASMASMNFTKDDFFDVVPFITNGKKNKEINDIWENWSKYNDITRGTLFYMMNLTKNT